MKSILDSAGMIVRTARVLAVPACILLALTACNNGSTVESTASASAPVVNSVEPETGPFGGGTAITIRGSNFLQVGSGTNTVRVGGILATDVVTVNDTTILAVTPQGTSGMRVDLDVRNTLGVGRLSGAFSYLAVATVLSDLNGDGIADMVVGAPRLDGAGTDAGAVYVFFGSEDPGLLIDRTADQADIILSGEAAGDQFGLTLAVGDMDGDGADDLAVGAHLHDGSNTDAGAVYVFYGPLTESAIAAASADVKLLGDGMVPGDRFGSALACGDLDGDSFGDLVVSATRHDVPSGGGSMVDAGCVYIFNGGPGLTNMNATQAGAAFDGLAAGDVLGNALACGDVDGDGVADLVMAACLRDPFVPPLMQDAGEVYVLCSAGGLAGRTLDQSDAILHGEAIRDEFGTTLRCGDIDGDGFADVVVGTPMNDALGTNVGRVYIFRGEAVPQSRSATDADVFLSGQPTNDAFGFAVTTGDMNGDGFEDVICGAPMASFTHNGSGRAFVYFGGEGMRDTVATQADVIYNGEPFADDRCGELVRVADVNHDGMADVLVAAPGNDAGGAGAGRAYVFLGGQTIGGQRSAADADVTLTGTEAGGMFGSSVADGQ